MFVREILITLFWSLVGLLVALLRWGDDILHPLQAWIGSLGALPIAAFTANQLVPFHRARGLLAAAISGWVSALCAAFVGTLICTRPVALSSDFSLSNVSDHVGETLVAVLVHGHSLMLGLGSCCGLHMYFARRSAECVPAAPRFERRRAGRVTAAPRPRPAASMAAIGPELERQLEGLVPTTDEVRALRSLGRSFDRRFVEWAWAQLAAGRDSRSLRRLAGETAPFHQLEMAALVDRVFAELGIAPCADRDRAAILLATAWVRFAVDGAVQPAAVLEALGRTYIDLEMRPRDLQDHYLLCCALHDLALVGYTYDWPGATRDNIEQIVQQHLHAWLQAHPPSADS